MSNNDISDPVQGLQLVATMSLANPEDAASVLEQFVHDGGYRHICTKLIIIRSL